MPWNESNRMDERIKFVARLLDGENMSRMCREFGIPRKTVYKIFNRHKDFGLGSLGGPGCSGIDKYEMIVDNSQLRRVTWHEPVFDAPPIFRGFKQ